MQATGACWGQGALGTFKVVADTVMCCATGPGEVTWCSPLVTAGTPCSAPDNSECVLPDQSATCACDQPGPIWRCLPIEGGVQYCDCHTTIQGCTDASADAGLNSDAGPDAALDAKGE